MKKAESKKDPNDDITEDDIYNIERRHSKLYEQSSYGSFINSLNLSIMKERWLTIITLKS